MIPRAVLPVLIALVLALPGRVQAEGAGFRLNLRPTDWDRISILFARPAGARLDLERGSPEAAAMRASRLAPLLAERTSINGAIGRISGSPTGAKDVFWTFGDRLGRISWPADAGPLAPGLAVAQRLDALAGPAGPAGLQDLAASLDPGSWVEIQLVPAAVTLRIAGGPDGEADARRQLQVERARDLAAVPVPGTRAPAWRTAAGAPRAWMLVGPILVLALGPDPAADLGLVGSRLEPMPSPAPVPPDQGR